MNTIWLDFEIDSSNSLRCWRKTSNLNISVTVRAFQLKSMHRARYESHISRGPIKSVQIRTNLTNRTFLVRIRNNWTVFMCCMGKEARCHYLCVGSGWRWTLGRWWQRVKAHWRGCVVDVVCDIGSVSCTECVVLSFVSSIVSFQYKKYIPATFLFL